MEASCIGGHEVSTAAIVGAERGTLEEFLEGRTDEGEGRAQFVGNVGEELHALLADALLLLSLLLLDLELILQLESAPIASDEPPREQGKQGEIGRHSIPTEPQGIGYAERAGGLDGLTPGLCTAGGAQAELVGAWWKGAKGYLVVGDVDPIVCDMFYFILITHMGCLGMIGGSEDDFDVIFGQLEGLHDVQRDGLGGLLKPFVVEGKDAFLGGEHELAVGLKEDAAGEIEEGELRMTRLGLCIGHDAARGGLIRLHVEQRNIVVGADDGLLSADGFDAANVEIGEALRISDDADVVGLLGVGEESYPVGRRDPEAMVGVVVEVLYGVGEKSVFLCEPFDELLLGIKDVEPIFVGCNPNLPLLISPDAVGLLTCEDVVDFGGGRDVSIFEGIDAAGTAYPNGVVGAVVIEGDGVDGSAVFLPHLGGVARGFVEKKESPVGCEEQMLGAVGRHGEHGTGEASAGNGVSLQELPPH